MMITVKSCVAQLARKRGMHVHVYQENSGLVDHAVDKNVTCISSMTCCTVYFFRFNETRELRE